MAEFVTIFKRADLAVSLEVWGGVEGDHANAIEKLGALGVTAVETPLMAAFPQISQSGLDSITAEEIQSFRETLSFHPKDHEPSVMRVAGVRSPKYSSESFMSVKRGGSEGLKKCMAGAIELAGRLGCSDIAPPTFVYGSPETRLLGTEEVSPEETYERAAEFLAPLVEQAKVDGLVFGIKPVEADAKSSVRGQKVFGGSAAELTDFAVRLRGDGVEGLVVVPDSAVMAAHDKGYIVEPISRARSEGVLASYAQLTEPNKALHGIETDLTGVHHLLDDALSTFWMNIITDTGPEEDFLPVLAIDASRKKYKDCLAGDALLMALDRAVEAAKSHYSNLLRVREIRV